MAIKTISSAYPAGYDVLDGVTEITVTSAGSIGGKGMVATAALEVDNDGRIAGAGYSDGVLLHGGGSVINHSQISGWIAVQSYGPTASLTNYGQVTAGTNAVDFSASTGLVSNGSLSDPQALIIGGASGILLGKGPVWNDGFIQANVIGVSTSGNIKNGDPLDTGAIIRADPSYGGGIAAIAGGAYTITNFGTLVGGEGGAEVAGAGEIVNGGSLDRQADIVGGTAVDIQQAGTVINFGALNGTALRAVEMDKGGALTNGSPGDPGASIFGPTGVYAAAGVTLRNFGLVEGFAGDGLTGTAGGFIVNGSAADATASIEGYSAIAMAEAATVTNYGSIIGQAGVAVSLAGGEILNGVASAPVGLIRGDLAVELTAPGTVANHGSINGLTGQGVLLKAAGKVSNGGPTDHAALIQGVTGVQLLAGGSIANFATIAGLGEANYGAQMHGGSLTNGTVTDTAALIEGYRGVGLAGASATNFATIVGQGSGAPAAVLGNGRLINEAPGLLEGALGAQVGASSTLDNFGTVDGLAGTSVTLTAASATLMAEAGSVFLGKAEGGGGTLDLASGVGTMSGLAGGAVTVSGSMATTTFQAFDDFEVGKGATFSISGAATLTAGQALIAAGSLSAGGALANAGLLDVLGGTLKAAGAVSGAGSVKIVGGLADFASTFSQNVAFGASGELELAHSQSYAGTVSGFSKSGGTSFDLGDIKFVSGATKATYSGTSASGVLKVTDGTHSASIKLTGNYLASAWVVATDPHGGTLVRDPQKAPATHAFADHAARLAPAAAASARPILMEEGSRPGSWLLTPRAAFA